MTTIVNPTAGFAIAPVGAAKESEFATLEARVLTAFARSEIGLRTDRQDVMRNIEQHPEKFSDPAYLFEMQKRLADYGLEVSAINTVTRKAVGAVEKLLGS